MLLYWLRCRYEKWVNCICISTFHPLLIFVVVLNKLPSTYYQVCWWISQWFGNVILMRIICIWLPYPKLLKVSDFTFNLVSLTFCLVTYFYQPPLSPSPPLFFEYWSSYRPHYQNPKSLNPKPNPHLKLLALREARRTKNTNEKFKQVKYQQMHLSRVLHSVISIVLSWWTCKKGVGTL